MSAKTRSIIRAIAVIMVALAVVMQLEILIVPSLMAYRFWIAVIAFGLVLFTAR